MRIAIIACIVCILFGILQVGIAVAALGNGGTVPFRDFTVSGAIAVAVGISLIAVLRRHGVGMKEGAGVRTSLDLSVAALALSVGILTLLLSFVLNRGYGSA